MPIEETVAVQQMFTIDRQYERLTAAEMHCEMLKVAHEDAKLTKQSNDYRAKYTVPACFAIINRYRKQGVAAKDRPNGQPTVEAYFRSINLNYSTVRSWIRRYRGITIRAASRSPKRSSRKPDPVLRASEQRLLGYLHSLMLYADDRENGLTPKKPDLPTYETLNRWIERDTIPPELTDGSIIEVQGQEFRVTKIDLSTLTIRVEPADKTLAFPAKKQPQLRKVA